MTEHVTMDVMPPISPVEDPDVAGTTATPPASVHLIVGDEEFLVARAVSELVAEARTAHPGCEIADRLAGELTVGSLAESLSPSLFGEARVVIVRNAQDARKELAGALLDFVQGLPENLVLIVTHAGGAKGKALADGLRKRGAAIVQCGRIVKQRERVEFARHEVMRNGGKCGEDVASQILDAVGSNLRELASACAQLVADTGGQVDVEAVRRYHRGKAEVTGFAVADEVMVGNVPEALAALRWSLSVGTDPVPIADALADGVRTVARVASAGRGNAYQMASELGLPPWKVERAQRQSRGWTPTGLAVAMQHAAALNRAVKGGAEDREYALEHAVIAMTQAHGAP